MERSTIAATVALVLLVAAASGSTQVTLAATCDPMQLSPCATAITSATAPTAACCGKLKEQRPCLCQYLKNPNLKKLINSPNARKVATTCGSPFPTC